MKKELYALLCSRYPLIFADRHAPMTQSCMYWGFSCGDGWFDLIATLCARRQFATDHNKAPQVVATQVKEKWGMLCFYYWGGNNEQSGMVDMAEALSERICEECGKPGKRRVSGAYMTRCAEHAPADSLDVAEWEKAQLEKKWLSDFRD